MLYEETRQKVCNLINAREKSEIVFTSGTTQSINWIVFGYFKNTKTRFCFRYTESEHASNILPWFKLAKDIGIKIKYIELNSDYEIDEEHLKKSITSRTKVISIAHITNVIGDTRDLKMISEIAHKNNILLVVDAAQSIAHSKIDVQNMDIDFLAFSAHKMYGPTGVGVLYGKYELLDKLEPMLYGGGMNAMFMENGYMELREIPTRLEAGTPNIEGVIGLGKAIDYLNDIGMDKIVKYEHDLRSYLLNKLNQLDFIEIYNANNKGTTLAFNINGVFSQDTAIYLDKYNICVRAGSHCAKILNNALNINNTCRISLSFYNTKEEIDLLINVLKNSENIWKEIL